MRYLIDGYNLLHATGHLGGPVRGAQLEHARAALLRRLAGFIKTQGGEATVVFDARNAPPHTRQEQDYHGVHVRYTRGGEADDLIEELIRAETAPQKMVVVSDDRRLKEAARRRHCVSQGCLDFYEATEQGPPSPPERPDKVPASPTPSLTDKEVRDWLRAFGAEDET